MAELADAPDLGSGGRPCGFESHYPYQRGRPKRGALFGILYGRRTKGSISEAPRRPTQCSLIGQAELMQASEASRSPTTRTKEGAPNGSPSFRFLFFYCISSSASASIWARLASFSAERILTPCSAKVMFLQPSSMARMPLAAIGAQLPFSMKATVRFW